MPDKAFNIAKNPKYDGYQRGLASMVYKCFDKKTSDRATENEIMSNKELVDELCKPMIRKFKKRKVHSFLWTIFEVLILLICNYPARTRRPGDVPWKFPKGCNVRDLQGTFRGLLVDQQKNWWFNEKGVF